MLSLCRHQSQLKAALLGVGVQDAPAPEVGGWLRSDPGLLHQISRLSLYRATQDDASCDAWLDGLAYAYPICPPPPVHMNSQAHTSAPSQPRSQEHVRMGISTCEG